jgi:peptidoglycan biosynthesis protein MviN/MurJ (putative lipid II flippase)
MGYDLAAVATVIALGHIFFGHFEERTPKWRKVLKLFLTLALTAVISYYFGHKGVAIAFAIMAIPVVLIHAWWLPKNGVNGWTAEPRERYYELRGWKR